MSFSAKITLLIFVTAGFLSNCSFGENIAPRKMIQPEIVSREKTLFDADKIELPYSFDEDTIALAENLT